MENDGPQVKKYKFVSHFNRDAMARGEKAVWVVRFRGQVIPAEEVEFRVPLRTKYRPEIEQQTRAVLEGFASELIQDQGRVTLQ
jgi:hypothetical protein